MIQVFPDSFKVGYKHDGTEINGIYGILCVEEEKWYIGSSYDIMARLYVHKRNIDIGFFAKYYFPHARSKGKLTFEFYILETITHDNHSGYREYRWMVKFGRERIVNKSLFGLFKLLENSHAKRSLKLD